MDVAEKKISERNRIFPNSSKKQRYKANHIQAILDKTQ